MQLDLARVLSDEEIEAIHVASLDILATSGVKILDRGMLELLAGRRLEVDTDAQTVKFGRG